MARVLELLEGFKDWYNERPEQIRALIDKYPPDRLYWLNPPGQRVTIIAYAEDGTVRVNVSGQWNCLTFERQVFGIDPADLTECDLPLPDEPVGAMTDMMEPDEIEPFMEQMRDQILTARGLKS